MTQCGNTNHPNGPWHEAAPIPLSWNWAERFRQWRNRKRWGCTCHEVITK
jgi:hypothetical protein